LASQAERKSESSQLNGIPLDYAILQYSLCVDEETVEETLSVIIKAERAGYGGSGNWFFQLVSRIK
jgi:nitrogen regulatory protein PII